VIEPGPGSATAAKTPVRELVRVMVNLGYATLLVIAAVLPPPSSIAGLTAPDWLAHAAAYGVQAGLLFWAVAPVVGRGRGLTVAFFGAAVFGALTEALQLLRPERAVEARDVAANIVGAAIVCGALFTAGRATTGRRK